jgi:hypothetical protein
MTYTYNNLDFAIEDENYEGKARKNSFFGGERLIELGNDVFFDKSMLDNESGDEYSPMPAVNNFNKIRDLLEVDKHQEGAFKVKKSLRSPKKPRARQVTLKADILKFKTAKAIMGLTLMLGNWNGKMSPKKGNKSPKKNLGKMSNNVGGALLKGLGLSSGDPAPTKLAPGGFLNRLIFGGMKQNGVLGSTK